MLSTRLLTLSTRRVIVRASSNLVKPDPNNVEQQAPNRVETWSPSQQPRTEALKGPRTVQRDMELQPRPYAAIDLIAKEPIRFIHDNVAVCDGNKGPQGHPKVYINLDQPKAHPCGYCGLRYAKDDFKTLLDGK